MGNIESLLGDDVNAARAAKAMVLEAARLTKEEEQPNETSKKVLLDYLANVMPPILKYGTVNGVYKTYMDAEKWKTLIEWPFGFFICGEDPEYGWEKVKEMNRPSQICGKVFDIGDPTYSCKDCAADPTCVFCNDCFHKSAHKDHRYRIHTSSGNGGYCDCGDVEAWKKDPFCELHLTGNSLDEERDPKDLLPNGVAKRAVFLYRELLQYCVDMILWTDDDGYEQLPDELKRSSANQKAKYLLMLYNDEVHTYDQVIRTLEQAIRCSKSEAIRYATIVDKEGRSLVHVGAKEASIKIRDDIKARTTRSVETGPLKCETIHQDIVAHQVAAIDLLGFINKITSYSDGLRRILCEQTLNAISPSTESLLDILLKADTSLWKVARAGCHQLFMNGVLVDPYGKRLFAIAFAKAYKFIMKDFIEDDHDHGISASSMSVQVFTVPSLAQMLMLEHDLMAVVFDTFLEHLNEAITDEGYIDFQDGRRGRAVSLKREGYILHDLGYLLLHKPQLWTPEFRALFMRAFDSFVRVLRGMQGMEPVVRKLLIHTEYEPNWETGFLMQLWMMPVIEAMITWTTSDPDVFKQVTEKCLYVILNAMPPLDFQIKSHTEIEPGLILINYDVSTQPVSVNLGLSRFIAGVLAVSLKNASSLEHLLNLEGRGKVESKKVLLTLMEYPLRTLVFAAQVSAGMWRRNGYSVVHQISYYQNVRCVSEMYDKDIIMLQVVGALMDNDHFLTAMLDKYGLLDWLKFDFEKSGLNEDLQRRIIVISEEFLLTLLAVLGERHVLGIGDVSARDILRKEVVHRLALGPASRSEIVKNLPSKDPGDEEDCTFESLLDDVLKSVADFRQPGLTGKGLYHLKQSCIEECSQYFYHYSRSEQSKALEQRRKEAKKANSSVGSKVPVPANFTKHYWSITNIFSCSTMAKILSVIFFRAIKNESKITSDTLIEEALYVVALGLYEEKRRRENHLPLASSFLDMITKPQSSLDKSKNTSWLHKMMAFGVTENTTIQSLLEELQKKSKSQEYGELVDWILSFIYEELSHKNEYETESSQIMKRKQDEVDKNAKADKERKAKLAKERRERVMAQMSQMQKSFIKKYEGFLELDDNSRDEDDIEMDDAMDIEIDSVAVGSGRKLPKQKIDNIICMLCQEKQDVTVNNRTIVMASFLQRSKVLSKAKGKNVMESGDFDPLFPPSNMFTGIFMNTCGHVMHHECWMKYHESLLEKAGRQIQRLQYHPRIDVMKYEYLCPLCSSYCNTVIPLLPSLEIKNNLSSEMDTDDDLPLFDRLLIELRKMLDNEINIITNEGSPPKSPLEQSCLSSFQTSIRNKAVEGFEFSTSALFMLQKFGSNAGTVGYRESPQGSNISKVLITWNTCAFSIQGIECSLRDENKSLFELTSRQTDCIGTLVRYSTMIGSIAETAEIRKECFKLLKALIPSNLSEVNFPCILDLDMFAIMVILRLSMQSINQTESTVGTLLSNENIDKFVLDIALQGFLTQLLLSAPSVIDSCDEHLKHIALVPVKEKLAALWGKMHLCSNVAATAEPHKQPEKLVCFVVQHCLPFIRSTALFFHFLTGISPPALLTQQDGNDHHKLIREIHAICGYLSLPADIVSLLPLDNKAQLDLSATEAMIERWCKHDSVRAYLTNSNSLAQIMKPGISPSRLIPLPREYSTLITSASGFRCPITGDISQNPTLCLVCGEMLCSQSYCCRALVDEMQVGSCTAHAQKCNETIGIFMLIRDCQILLLYNRTKGCLMPSPYLDEYGEPDIKFRRGNPLYLCTGRYNNLQKLWLSHLIPQEVVRQMESTRPYLSVDWPQFL